MSILRPNFRPNSKVKGEADPGIGHRSTSLTRTSFALGAVNLCVKPVSLIKEMYVASLFGTSAQMDRFSLALGIPTLISSLLSVPIATSFIPAFLRERAVGDGERFRREITGGLVLVALAVASLVVIFRSSIVSVAAPGLSTDERAEVAKLVLFLSPYLVFVILGEFQLQVLAALRKFIQASVWQVLIPIATIVALYIYAPTVLTMTVGLGTGALLVVIATTVSLMSSGCRGISWPRRSTALDAMSKQLPFLLLSTTLLQLNLFIDRLMASSLPVGGVAALAYAYRLLMLMEILFVAPFGQLLLTHFSEQAAHGELGRLVETANRATRSAILALLPVCIFGVLFAADCTRFVYQRGEFSVESTTATARAFAAYLPTVLILGGTFSYPRYFNATDRNRFMLIQTCLSLILNVVFNFLFMPKWGHVGIAASTSLTILIGRLVLFSRMSWLVRSNGTLQGVHHLGTLTVGGLTFLAVWGLSSWFQQSWPVLLRLALGALSTFGIYLLLIRVFRSEDLYELIRSLRARA